MKHTFFIIIGVTCIVSLLSCTKQNNSIAASEIFQTGNPKGGKEDDNSPIVMRVLNAQDTPVASASVTMINSSDTLYQVTDSIGNCRLTLPRAGDWRVQITCVNYATLDTLVNYDSVTSIKYVVLRQE